MKEGSGDVFEAFREKVANRTVRVGVVGLGYVGLPLALAFTHRGVGVIGVDMDEKKRDALLEKRSYIHTISAAPIAEAVEAGLLCPTTDFARLREADAIIICVPTPLNANREPDLSFVARTMEMIAPHLRRGHLICLESTTYPGTSKEIIQPHLERSGLKLGEEVFLVYSPEREDPGNINFSTSTTPKVVGGQNPAALTLGLDLYGLVVEKTVPVSSLETAEAVKLTENIFRAVNIALVNELKMTFDRMGIDVWEVIDAAKTKPFGYMPFYPGPGLGGHCIPIDPFYLTWKAREFGISTRFIELSGEINNAMPDYVLTRLQDTLDRRFKKGLNGSKILLVGLAYKKNVDDTRESPAFHLLEALTERGAEVSYHDPYVPVVPPLRKFPHLRGRKGIAMDEIESHDFDAALICTDHDCVDYQALVDSVKLVVDTRNATRDVKRNRDRIVKA